MTANRMNIRAAPMSAPKKPNGPHCGQLCDRSASAATAARRDKGGSKLALALVLCHESDDVAALLASKGQQLRMRPKLRFPTMQLHDPPA